MKPLLLIPGPLVTGGPENNHQIAHGLRELGIDCRVQYYRTDATGYEPISWGEDNPFPSRYAVEFVRPGDGFAPTHVILGAVDHRVKDVLPALPRAIHWNVTPGFCRQIRGVGKIEGNLARSLETQSRRRLIVEEINSRGFWELRAGWAFRPEESNLLHLVQSYTALVELQKLKKDPLLVFDYCHQDFFDAVTKGDEGTVRDIDVIYQKRSEPHASAVLEGMGLKTQLLQGLSRQQLIETMKRAKCYLDLGNHPGRDRMPREAVVCGAVAVIGKFGTANLFADVPCLPDLRVNRWDHNGIRSAVRNAVDEAESYRERQKYFAESIRRQKMEFDKQLLDFVTVFSSWPSRKH